MTRTIYLFSAVLLTISACKQSGSSSGAGSEARPAAEGKKPASDDIVLGILADLTGATADVGKPYNEGMLAYLDNLNAQGGIKGRKINALSEDYAYKIPNAEEKYKKYVQAGAVAIQGWGTGDSEALRSKVKGDELPFMSASYAEVLTDPKQSPYNFVVAPTYSDQMRIALDRIAASDPTAQVAVFHHDSPFGMAPVADGEQWIKDRGYKLGYKDYAMKGGATDHVGLLQQAKAQGAKFIVIQNVSSPAATVARDVAAQKLDMKIVCLNWCSDELFVKLAGPAAEGHWMVQPFAPPTAGKPGHESVRTYAKAKGFDLEAKGLHFVQGWYTMHVMARGLEKVAADGKPLTGPNLRTALETMDPVDTGGVIGPVRFSADSHRGATAAGIYKVEGGKMVEVATAVTPQK
ncbi:MAG: branched-chain amino acid ABC transporter substrate-binding protein [Deltaproteobacteria bacterium]|nr:MAG: branched-chain amino acid ABC transporter substrate-binding protein [Deltaproteobacteria bacterium]